MANTIDSRLLEPNGEPENIENFNRVLAMIDGIAAVARVYITFDSDGGSAVAKQEVKYNTAGTEPEDPTKEDYTFAGWYEGDVEFDWDTLLTEDKTLTAHWEAAE